MKTRHAKRKDKRKVYLVWIDYGTRNHWALASVHGTAKRAIAERDAILAEESRMLAVISSSEVL